MFFGALRVWCWEGVLACVLLVPVPGLAGVWCCRRFLGWEMGLVH